MIKQTELVEEWERARNQAYVAYIHAKESYEYAKEKHQKAIAGLTEETKS